MGILYIVPTPVGNMEDITARALRILRETDLIVAEDTRTTGNLLRHFGIEKAMLSHHKFNEHQTAARLVERLQGGENVALVSDAGTPGISDPGFLLAREAIRAGIEVITLPGATAFVPALVSSGLPCDKFCFEGFLPQKKGRASRLEELKDERRTMIFYESPRRVVRTLEEFAEVFGRERPVSVSREISKLHEESVRGTVEKVLDHFREQEPRGEFVIVLGGSAEPKSHGTQAEEQTEAAGEKPLSKYKRKLIKREENMKKFLFTLIGMAVCLTSCNNTAKDSAEEGERERDSLMQLLDQKNSELDDLVSSINEIQDGFRRINEAEGRVTIANSSPESTSTKETIRENIAYIQDAMEKNREMIAQLQQKLKTSSFNVSSLEKTLENLQQQMDEKDASIQELRAAIMEKDSLILVQDNQINDLNSDVSALSADNKQKAATVASQDKELNKAWFVFGTKAELKEQKILANNDVLRSDDFNRNYFTEVDIRTLKEINLYSKKAELLTSHPEGSYTLKKNSSGEYVLTVTNAKKFWSVSRYLVILVK